MKMSDGYWIILGVFIGNMAVMLVLFGLVSVGFGWKHAMGMMSLIAFYDFMRGDNK